MRWRKITGLSLVVVGCAGLMTVADDFRHTGELYGVASILLAGLVLLVADVDCVITRRLALHWVAVGLGFGVVVGAVMDSMSAGVGGGALLGTLGAAIMSPRRS